MFKRNPARTSAVLATPTFAVAPDELVLGYASGLDREVRAALSLNVPGTAYNWQLSANDNAISFPRASGSATGATEVIVVVRLPDNLGAGRHRIGGDVRHGDCIGGRKRSDHRPDGHCIG